MPVIPAAIRRLGPAEIDAWASLRQLQWPERNRADFQHEGRRLVQDPRRAGFVALLPDGAAAGICEVGLRDTAEGCATTPVAFLEGWFVRADARARGIGRALVEAAIGWARTRGCREFASDTALGDEAALAAHAALGFQEVARVVCLRLPL